MRAQKQPIQQCFNEDDNLGKLEGLPRDMDNFWRNDLSCPPGTISGQAALHLGSENKSTAFSHRERQLLSIHGLMPVAVYSVENQVERCRLVIDSFTNELQKTIYMLDLEAANRRLFYKVIMSNPLKYLDVFQSSEKDFLLKQYSNIYTTVRGMFVTIKDKGHIYDVLKNWPNRFAVRYIVVANGANVLSMGDHGCNAMALVFYRKYQNVVIAGINPDSCLPVMLDVGTDSEHLLNDKGYVGLRESRCTGPEYEAFFEEFTLAVMRLFGPRTIIQTHTFKSHDALKQLELYRKRQCFMDIDLQCRGACGLAGLLSAIQITKECFKENMMLFYGDNPFNIGMARLCLNHLKRLGVDETTAKSRIWFFDNKGLVVHARCKHKVSDYLKEFKHVHEPVNSLVEAIEKIKPNVLIGCSSEPKAFTKEVLKAMEQSAKQPIIYSMSRPLDFTECSANDAFVYTKGRCIFISGVSLPPLKYANKWYQPGYCSAQYMLSGLTLGVMLSGMTTIPDETFLVAAQRLACLVWPNDLDKRDVFPPMRKLKCINLQIAEAVFTFAYRRRLATLWPEPKNPRIYINSMLYTADYKDAIPTTYCTSNVMIGTTESLAYYKHKI